MIFSNNAFSNFILYLLVSEFLIWLRYISLLLFWVTWHVEGMLSLFIWFFLASFCYLGNLVAIHIFFPLQSTILYELKLPTKAERMEWWWYTWKVKMHILFDITYFRTKIAAQVLKNVRWSAWRIVLALYTHFLP